MAIGGNRIVVRLGLEGLKGFEQRLKKASFAMRKAGQNMKRNGEELSKMVTLPVVGVGIAAIKTAADFEASMNKVSAISGATGADFEKLKKQARDLGGSTVFSAKQAAEGMTFLSMAGLDVNEVYDAMPATLNLAAAAGIDLASAADIASNIMSGFGMEASELGGIVDVMAKQMTTSNTNLTQLGEAMSYVAPVASSFGVSITETSAAIGLLSDAGIQGQRAGTGLRNVITKLSDNADQLGIKVYDATGQMLPLADIIQSLEKRGISTAEAMDLFGERAGPALLALLSRGSAALREQNEVLQDVGGTAEKIANKQLEGFYGQLKQLRSAAEELMITIADSGLLKAVTGLAERATDVARSLAQTNPTLLKTITVIAGLAAAIGPLLIVLGQAKIAMAALGFTTAAYVPRLGLVIKKMPLVIGAFARFGLSVKAVNIAMRANPIGLVITAISLLIPLVTALYNNFEPVKKVVDAVWFALKGLGSFIATYFISQIKGFLKVLSGLWKAMKGDFKEGMKEVGQAIWENNPVAAAAKSGKALADSIADSYIEQNKKRAEDYKKAQEEVMNTISEVFMKKKESPKQTSLDQFFKDGTPTNDGGGGGGLPPAELSAYQEKTKLVGELEAKIRDLIVANKDYTEEAKELQRLRDELELINYEFDNIGTAAPKLAVTFKPIEGLPTALESATNGLDKMGVKINDFALTSKEKLEKAFEDLGDLLGEFGDVVAEWMPAIQGLFDFWGQALDNKAAKQQKQYEEEMQRIQNSTMSEKKKEEAIAKLNEKRDKQERKLAREKAKRDKAVALFNAIISVAAQVAKVVGNPILAAIVAGIGAAQIAAIAAEPLPALAEGGLAYGPTMALVGDNTGARVDPEVISPLSKLKDMMGGQQDIRLSGAFRIQGQDLFLALEEANQIRVRR